MFSLGKICRATSVYMYRPSICYSMSSDDCGGKDDPPPECRTLCPSDFNPSTPTMYDCRKYGHCLPSNNVTPPFEPLENVPTGVFRCTAGEMLGRGAAKCSYYQNPEYFAYHNMSFYDIHLILRGCRIASPKTGRKP